MMSNFLRGLGNFVAIVGGLLGFVLTLFVIYAIGGGTGVIIAIVIFPITFVLIPFYTLFVYGSWNLLLINYGSMAAGWVLHWIADRMEQGPSASKVAAVRGISEIQTPKENARGHGFAWVFAGMVFLFLVLFGIFSSSNSPKASPTHTPRPTAAATKTTRPRPTWTPRPVSIRACVTSSTIRVREGPGTDYAVVGGMVSGTCMSIWGRNNDSTWVYIISDDNTRGWVAAWLLTIEGDLKRVSIKSTSDALSLEPTAKIIPTRTKKPPPTATRKPLIVFTNTPHPALSAFIPLCSQTADKVGERVSCKVERAYCDYLPAVDGSPTFCNDRPYPNQSFTLVVFGEDWSDYDGSCIVVSGTISLYRGVLQILATSRSQVSYCQ